jgi:tRNA pseudouridine13 synthase
MSRLKPPDLERAIGIECYKTSAAGIGGWIKQQPDDFVVEEVTQDGVLLEAGVDGIVLQHASEGRFVHCTLEKKNWDTMRAVKEIARRLKVSQRRVGYAGTKDKKAVTTQRISVGGKTIEELKGVNIKDITLRDFSYGDDGIGLGALNGNRFTITVRGVILDGDAVKGVVEGISGGIASGFPNFFGVQRFGTTRPITHLVGRRIMDGDFEGAVLAYLSMAFEGEDSETASWRKGIADSMDFRSALNNAPRNLGYEAALLNHLVRMPGDFRGALAALPAGLSRMFVHAYQSYVFNRSLSRYIESDIVVERLPLAGFESSVDEFTAGVLEEEGVRLEDFRVRGMPTLGSRGELRDCFVGVEDIKLLEVRPDELNEGCSAAVLRFTLPPGAYATTLLREYMKNEYWKDVSKPQE